MKQMKFSKPLAMALVMALCAFGLVACDGNTAATPTPAPITTPSPEDVATPTPEETPEATPTEEQTPPTTELTEQDIQDLIRAGKFDAAAEVTVGELMDKVFTEPAYVVTPAEDGTYGVVFTGKCTVDEAETTMQLNFTVNADGTWTLVDGLLGEEAQTAAQLTETIQTIADAVDAGDAKTEDE